jgi:hypothetical protein
LTRLATRLLTPAPTLAPDDAPLTGSWTSKTGGMGQFLTRCLRSGHGLRQAVNLQQSYVHLRPRGAADVLVKSGVGVTTKGDATVVWDPEVEGLLASEA